MTYYVNGIFIKINNEIMKRVLLLVLVFFGTIGCGLSQSDFEKLTGTMNDFMKGVSHSMPDLVLSTFYENATLYLTMGDGQLKQFTAQEYSNFFNKKEYGEFNGRTGNVIGIENDLATATADSYIETFRYVDKYLLRRFDGEWKIISKASTRYVIPAE
ncbi:MAG: hypothetical protein ACI9FN_004004 [Saprospiraceae bacterium]|jgi:hypothetical protein